MLKKNQMAFKAVTPISNRDMTAKGTQGGCASTAHLALSLPSSHPGSLQIQSHTQAAQALVLIMPLPTWSLAQTHSSSKCLASIEYSSTPPFSEVSRSLPLLPLHLLPPSPQDFLEVPISLNSFLPASYHSSVSSHPALREVPHEGGDRGYVYKDQDVVF